MRLKRLSQCALVLSVLLIAAGGSFAQDNGAGKVALPDPNQTAAANILTLVPGDAPIFFGVKNANDLLIKIENAAGKIGLGDDLAQACPKGLLKTVCQELNLGAGYNPNGGVGIVVTNLKKSGVDLENIEESLPQNIPVVILVAGTDVKSFLPGGAREQEDGKLVLPSPMGPMEIKVVGSYLAISPNPKALAQIGQGKSLVKTLAADHAELLKRSDVMIYYNLDALMPAIKIGIAKFKEGMGQGGGMDLNMMLPMMMMDGVLETIEQVNAVSIGIRIAPTGTILESLADYKPDSQLAKQIAAYKPTSKSLVHRLPNLPYVLAGGVQMTETGTKDTTEMSVAMLNQLLKIAGLEIPKDLSDRMVALGTELGKEIIACQFVAGGPKEDGLFGVAMVLECHSAEKTKGLLKKKATLITELVQATIGMKEEEFQSLRFEYKEKVETIDGTSIDAIEIQHDELSEKNEEAGEMMKLVLADEKIRFLIAQVNAKTLVITFGGGKEMLGAAMTAAAKGGTIDKDPGVLAARKFLPKKLIFQMYFDGRNLWNTVQAGMKKMEAKSDLPEFTFQAKTPIALGSTVKGTMAHGVIYVPNVIVSDVIRWIKAEEDMRLKQRQEREIEIKAAEQGNDM